MINFRRQLVVYPRIQYLLLTVSLAFLILGAAVGINFFRMIEEDPTGDALVSTQNFIPIFGLTLLVLVSMLGANLLVSNRIVGPIYRIKKHIDALAKGENLGPVKLRDDDYFTELAESYNQALEKLNKR